MSPTRRAVLGGLALIAAPTPIIPREPTMLTLPALEDATFGAASAYMRGEPIPDLITRVRQLLARTQEHQRGPTRLDALRLQSWQCAVLASLAAGAGQRELARGYLMAAHTQAREATEGRVVSRTYITSAQLDLWPGGDPSRAVAIATEGLRQTPITDRQQHARLAALLMEGRAKLGGRRDFDRAVTTARRAHAYLDAGESSLFGFTSQQMHSSLATALADMGDRSAVDHAEMAYVRYPADAPAVRHMVEYTKAYALAKTGAPADAVGVALAAITSAREPSWLDSDRSRWVLGALPEGYDSPERRELAEIAGR